MFVLRVQLWGVEPERREETQRLKPPLGRSGLTWVSVARLRALAILRKEKKWAAALLGVSAFVRVIHVVLSACSDTDWTNRGLKTDADTVGTNGGRKTDADTDWTTGGRKTEGQTSPASQSISALPPSLDVGYDMQWCPLDAALDVQHVVPLASDVSHVSDRKSVV